MWKTLVKIFLFAKYNGITAVITLQTHCLHHCVLHWTKRPFQPIGKINFLFHKTLQCKYIKPGKRLPLPLKKVHNSKSTSSLLNKKVILAAWPKEKWQWNSQWPVKLMPHSQWDWYSSFPLKQTFLQPQSECLFIISLWNNNINNNNIKGFFNTGI